MSQLYRYLLFPISSLLFVLCTSAVLGQIDARMLRMPDVSDTQISFVYAGDIWVVPKEGGLAQRLSSPPGEETLPRFSPDGTSIAFNANYDGNTDIYVIPAVGGIPVRVTHHPASDRMLDWYPDGNGLLMASAMESGRQRFSQLFRVDKEGGIPEKLAVPYGEFGAISPDGKMLAYMPKTRDYRTWKRYRGGMMPEIWLFNLLTLESENITQGKGNEGHPMWHKNTLYFLSDRGPRQRHNIWSYDLNRKRFEQITKFEDFDVHFPAIGPDEIVFEAGGKLYLLDLDNERYKQVKIQVVTDNRTLKPKLQKVGEQVQNAWISPTGKRAVFEARGEIFTVPEEHGVIRNLTNDSGVGERFPSWSPDGKLIAYWSDKSGEYELYVRKPDGSDEKKVSSLGPGFRYRPYWSPDSKKIAFVDQTMKIQILELNTGQVAAVDQALYMYQGALSNFRVSWSSDSRWMAYSRGLPDTRRSAIFVFDTQENTRHQLTSGYYSDSLPEFDPEGKYLYFLTDRSFNPSYSDFDNSWIYSNATQIAAASLRGDVASPLAPRNDEEPLPEEKTEEQGEPSESENSTEGTGEQEKDADVNEEKTENGGSAVEIDLEGFERRVVVLPPKAGNYSQLQAAPGKVVFLRRPRTGSEPGSKSSMLFYDLKEREEKEILDGVNSFLISFDNKKALVFQAGKFAIINLAPGQKVKSPLPTAELEMTIDPRAEWKQIFNDAWRLERDFFYDKNMHGVDWPAMKIQYGNLLDDAVTRWDVNYILGELIGELNASHTYRGGGDTESAQNQDVGLLGIDWSLENGAFRIKRIIRGADWDTEARSPLDEPGMEVKEGDYILAVNGVPLDTAKNPWASFQGLANKTVILNINDQPSLDGSKEVVVKTVGSENRIRHLEWIENNRLRVEEASGGKIGYIYVRSTGIDGQSELVRQFYPQFGKEGLIIDERFNSGGQIPDRFIEVLNRKPLSFWAVRDGKDWQWPPVAHFGPKAMLINGWSGSGGDAFPFYFREYGIGPLIGTKTWGGLIGMTGAPQLIDGGTVTCPTFRMYDIRGEWFAEGHGVDPDIEVIEDPTAMAKGSDPQLERAVKEVLRMLEENPPAKPNRPAYEDRTVQ